ncbi:hypothetical protein ACCUM_1172 [Candidatus Accumulibacter phosphatis]|uniref:Uncharacterized protein n=1 Tax=Candidatus Accumulibacter phosphatis TaxID=327160 RepID=A0A5S4F470_9PROT|nr:hypothetical protein ACCUM_1172 [Candidatus Accumulibacter phosphatis]
MGATILTEVLAGFAALGLPGGCCAYKLPAKRRPAASSATRRING